MRPMFACRRLRAALCRRLPIRSRHCSRRSTGSNGRLSPGLPDDPGEVFADSAYRGNHFGDAVRAKGGVPRIVATGMWARDEAEILKRLDTWNRPIHRVRGRIEKFFGTGKRSTACAACDGAALPKPPRRSASPPSPTTSNALSPLSLRRVEGKAVQLSWPTQPARR